jgi:hypothetical protein
MRALDRVTLHSHGHSTIGHRLVSVPSLYPYSRPKGGFTGVASASPRLRGDPFLRPLRSSRSIYVERFFTGTGMPGILTPTENSVLRVVK